MLVFLPPRESVITCSSFWENPFFRFHTIQHKVEFRRFLRKIKLKSLKHFDEFSRRLHLKVFSRSSKILTIKSYNHRKNQTFLYFIFSWKLKFRFFFYVCRILENWHYLPSKIVKDCLDLHKNSHLENHFIVVVQVIWFKLSKQFNFSTRIFD